MNHDHLFRLVHLVLKPMLEVLIDLNKREKKMFHIILYLNRYTYLVLLLNLDDLVGQEYLFEKRRRSMK